MSDPRGLAPRAPDAHDAHAGHDLELVARGAVGDLAAHEVAVARDRIATCELCADLAVDLRSIAAATRELRGGAVTAAPRDFRLTEADAARLGRRGILGRLRPAARLGAAAGRGFGGALATLGLVGLLVSAALPGILPAAGQASSQEVGSTIRTDNASPIAITGPQATTAHEFAASGDPARAGDASMDETGAAPTWPAILAIPSAALLVAGLALLLAGRPQRRTGP